MGEDHDRSRVCLVFTNCSHDLVVNRQLRDSKISTNSNNDVNVRVIGIVNHGLGEGTHGQVQTFGPALSRVEAAFEVMVFGVAIGGVANGTRRSCCPGFRAGLGASIAGAEDPNRE